jgi:hypothetical protein
VDIAALEQQFFFGVCLQGARPDRAMSSSVARHAGKCARVLARGMKLKGIPTSLLADDQQTEERELKASYAAPTSTSLSGTTLL